MNLLLNLFAIILIAGRRIWAQRALVACLLVGLIAAVALITSIPLYADAVHFRLLQKELAGKDTAHPPFAFMFRYIGAWHGAVEWDAYQPVDVYLTEQAPATLGLPLELIVRHVRTDNFRLFAEEGGAAGAYARRQPLLWTSLGFISGLENHVDLIEGRLPRPAEAGDPSTLRLRSGQAGSGHREVIEVLVSRTLAEKLGLQVGERYVLFGKDELTQLPVRIAGVWQARDATDPFWFYAPKSFQEVLLVPEATFVDRLAPALPDEVYQAVWYMVFDGHSVRAANVPGLLERVATVQARAASLLSNTSLDVSPLEALRAYRRAAQLLTVQLAVFSLPVLGLILYFSGLNGGMVVRRQQNEIAILRSRGASRWQVIGIYLLERLLIGLVAAGVGLVLGRGLAQLLGGVRTFLDPGILTTRSALPVLLSPTSVYFALGAAMAGLVASVFPTLAAAHHTIVSYKQEVARVLRPPVWQRYFLDLLLLILPLYGYYMLRQRGALSILGRGLAGGDPFQNPLLFLVPALFCFALTLVCIRFFPVLMSALAWLAERLPGASLLLALRHLARSPAHYVGPLALLILTLSLATFTASMAQTLDAHLTDQVYYQVGADLNLAELGESTAAPPPAGQPGPSPRPDQSAEEAQWLFLPVSEHLQIPGVRGAARVGDYTAIARAGDRPEVGRLIGVDRVDFSRVAFFRRDFAGGQPLGVLMNALASGYNHVLVSRSFLARHGLGIGDRLLLTVQVLDERAETAFVVAGVLDLFPTAYPGDGPVFVANLDYIYQQLGGMFPYNVWLSLRDDADPVAVVDGVRELGLQVVTVGDAQGLIVAERTRPERQGLFGLLSIGFATAAGLTVLGFLLYSVVSFRRRFIELGMLRAVGLSVAQMATFLTVEQALIILSGGAVGTGLGVWASQLFIPFLQVGLQTPPFIVRIAWSDLLIIYAIFGAILAVAVVVLVGLLVRMRMFEAIKLGEAV
jgi:putative ABC transport system permease protein